MDSGLGGSPTGCSFVTVSKAAGVALVQIDVIVPTGASAWRIRLRDAAQRVAADAIENCTMWAIPHLVPACQDWLVYSHNLAGRELMPSFMQRLPTREAAEMWMLHHAE